ncbi:hypothetical protein DN603_13475 [Raoultella planticola]|uniref:Uncharacterized protein n=1 Tax=Raoultella planticola TaxID=575 RepID=A0A443VMH6_RAOPL|nr:hypothetical protein DN603_13475 [Raoultella planticola]
MSRYRRCPVRLFPSHLGKSSLSFITLILFVFHAASILTVLVHPSHIVVYAAGDVLAYASCRAKSMESCVIT